MSETADVSIPDEIAALSFEEALEALDDVVSKLESGRAPLDESIALYTRGTVLRAHCQSKLKEAQSRIEALKIGPDGAPTGTVPFGDAG